ncbi:MAG: DUF559 domain-containing protein [Propionicimonas sp.]
MTNHDLLLRQNRGLIRAADHPRRRAAFYRLVETGALQIVLPGVLTAPGAVSPETWLRALCAWCPQGVLHERTAMALWLGERPDVIRLTVTTRRAGPKGVRLTNRQIPAEFVTRRDGMTLTSPAYAASECAAWDGGERLMIGLRQGIIYADQLQPALDALAGTPGQRTRAPIVAASQQNPWSFAERLLQKILREADITGWVANRAIRINGQRYHPDILFPEHRLVVEFDGYAEHSKRRQFQTDHDRRNVFSLGRHWMLSFTWEDITERPEYVVRTVRTMLAVLAGEI